MSVLAVVAAVDRCNSDDLTFKGLSKGRRPQSPTGELVRGKGSENCEIGRLIERKLSGVSASLRG